MVRRKQPKIPFLVFSLLCVFVVFGPYTIKFKTRLLKKYTNETSESRDCWFALMSALAVLKSVSCNSQMNSYLLVSG